MYICTATADNDLIYHVLPDELARMHSTLAAISGKSMVEGKEEDPRGLVTETTRLFEWLVPAALHHTAEKVHTHTNTNTYMERLDLFKVHTHTNINTHMHGTDSICLIGLCPL